MTTRQPMSVDVVAHRRMFPPGRKVGKFGAAKAVRARPMLPAQWVQQAQFVRVGRRWIWSSEAVVRAREAEVAPWREVAQALFAVEAVEEFWVDVSHPLARVAVLQLDACPTGPMRSGVVAVVAMQLEVQQAHLLQQVHSVQQVHLVQQVRRVDWRASRVAACLLFWG